MYVYEKMTYLSRTRPVEKSLFYGSCSTQIGHLLSAILSLRVYLSRTRPVEKTRIDLNRELEKTHKNKRSVTQKHS